METLPWMLREEWHGPDWGSFQIHSVPDSGRFVHHRQSLFMVRRRPHYWRKPIFSALLSVWIEKRSFNFNSQIPPLCRTLASCRVPKSISESPKLRSFIILLYYSILISCQILHSCFYWVRYMNPVDNSPLFLWVQKVN